MQTKRKKSIATRLITNFIYSSFIPFLCIIVISASLTDYYYKKDILTVTDGYINSLSAEISFYMKDIEQITLLPYFSNETFRLIQILSQEENILYFDKIHLESTIDSLISSIRYTRDDFYSAIIVSDKNVLYSGSNYTWAEPIPHYDWKNEKWFKDVLLLEGSTLFLPRHSPKYYDIEYEQDVISIVKPIYNLITRQPYSVIKIDILPSAFDKFFTNISFHVPFCIYITDKQDNLIYKKVSSDNMAKFLFTEESDDNYLLKGINENATLHLSRDVPNTSYIINVILNKSSIRWKSARIYVFGILFYLVACVIAYLLNKEFSRRIYEPVEEINRVLKTVQKEDLSASFHAKPHWELLEVGESINTMIKELDNKIKTSYVAELNRKEAENRALLSQIQPHFLFNTIDSMIALLYEEKISDLEKSLYSLSDMLHYVLRKEQIVRLEEEINFIKAYLQLQHIRFQNRMSYEINIDERVNSVFVPRLLLQPFVENAIIHGLEPLTRPTTIKIDCVKIGKNIFIKIIDDGAGFESQNIDIKKGVGIANCIDRLSLLYNTSSINVESKTDEGCTVTITFSEVIDENINS